ncbi:MAG: hypothetical protein GF353_28035 [Candidatus Lokiarchaeota archaeon]|nr:hypothetical protein [Candidatus Lokiarchaeota archaeon]
MKSFRFNNSVVSDVLEEIKKAEEFIKIAIFQIHLEELFNILEEKRVNEGVEIDIFTLPFDSINDSVREDVVTRLNRLSDLGINIYFCKWNVGDPERTSTAIGRWYSYHGKFIVTDKSAIILSANFTRSDELDAALFIENEQTFIDNFKQKFYELQDLFIIEQEGYNGKIRREIINTGLDNIENIFELPNVIETTTHQNHWIKHYPAKLCPDNIDIEEKLYLAPFNVKARKIYEKLLNQAEKYIYISAESFTDVEFALFLRQLKIKKDIDICLLAGFTSMDFSDRIQKMYRELIANDIKLYTIEEDLHAKLIITDKHLLIGSINLNKMNLGFNKTKKYWRENTETFFISSNDTVIQDAKNKFLHQISNSLTMESKLAEKVQKEVTEILNKSFNIKVRKEVKELFSKFILIKEIEVKKDANKLAKITKKLMKHYDVKIANKDTFIMAIILFYLQDRKHTLSEIRNKLNKIEIIDNLNVLIEKLNNSDFVELDEDFYKIKIESLFE